MKREIGFYWVRYRSLWHVAEWTELGYWEVTHNNQCYTDEEWDEINETRLVAPLKKVDPKA